MTPLTSHTPTVCPSQDRVTDWLASGDRPVTGKHVASTMAPKLAPTSLLSVGQGGIVSLDTRAPPKRPGRPSGSTTVAPAAPARALNPFDTRMLPVATKRQVRADTHSPAPRHCCAFWSPLGRCVAASRTSNYVHIPPHPRALTTWPSPFATRRAHLQPHTPSTAWHEIGKAEMTQRLKDDLNVVAMLGVIDPKRFYKRSDYKKGKLPTNVQVGTVVEGPTEFKTARLKRSDRCALRRRESPRGCAHMPCTRAEYFARPPRPPRRVSISWPPLTSCQNC